MDNPGSTLKTNPDGGGWIVQNFKIRKPKTNWENHDYVSEGTDEETEPDYKNDMLEEKKELTDNFSRSNDEGWFYDKTDGDWENNLIDPDTESPF